MAVTASAYNSLTCKKEKKINSPFGQTYLRRIEQTRWASWGQYTVTLCEVYGRCEFATGGLGVFVAIKKNDAWGSWANASVKPDGRPTAITDDVTLTGDMKWSTGVGIGSNGYPEVHTVFRGFLYY